MAPLILPRIEELTFQQQNIIKDIDYKKIEKVRDIISDIRNITEFQTAKCVGFWCYDCLYRTQCKTYNQKYNKIEDYKVQIDKIKTQTIKDLERQKQNIYNDDIWKLEHQLKIEIPNKEKKYNQQIKALEYSLNDTNVKNSYIIGDMIVKDYPAKPDINIKKNQTGFAYV